MLAFLSARGRAGLLEHDILIIVDTIQLNRDLQLLTRRHGLVIVVHEAYQFIFLQILILDRCAHVRFIALWDRDFVVLIDFDDALLRSGILWPVLRFFLLLAFNSVGH